MSYILDALRKSDQQRRLGGVPTLSSAAAMSAPSGMPTIVARRLLGMFSITVLAMAIIWLRPSIMERIAPEPVAMPPEPPRSSAPGNTARPVAHAVVPVTVVAAVDDRGSGLAKSAEDQMSRGKSQAEPGRLATPMRKSLPAMVVAVHAYSNKPEDRLVSINGQLLKEGDTLSPGLILEQITPEGMIFDYRGKRIQRKAR